MPSFYERNLSGKFFITVISTKQLKPLNFAHWDVASLTEQRARSLQAIDKDVKAAAFGEPFKENTMFNREQGQSTSLSTTSSSKEEKDEEEKFEEVKDKLLKCAMAHELRLKHLVEALDNKDMLTRVEFKEQMVSLGFGISELPDTDFKVLGGSSGLIASAKLAEIFRDELNKRKIYKVHAAGSHEDDIIFRPTSGMPGKIKIQVLEASDLPRPTPSTPSRSRPFGEFSSLKLLHTSGIVKVGARQKIMVRIWKCKSGAMIPIALDLRSGMEYGFEDLAVLPQTECVNGYERIEWGKYRLCKHELEKKDLFENGADLQTLNKKIYLPQREAYAEEAIAKHFSAGNATPASRNVHVYPGKGRLIRDVAFWKCRICERPNG